MIAEQDKITARQLGAIHATLQELGMVKMKGALVHSYTGGRTESSAGMTKAEGIELIRYLKNLSGETEKMDRMRKKVIAMAMDMGWTKTTPTMSAENRGPAKIDMERLNGWCEKSGMYHKALDKHTEKELPQLVTQFEKVYRSYLNGL